MKLGVYGMLRINYTMLPDGVFWFAGALAVLGLINVIWGAMCALAQKDLKKLVYIRPLITWATLFLEWLL